MIPYLTCLTFGIVCAIFILWREAFRFFYHGKSYLLTKWIPLPMNIMNLPYLHHYTTIKSGITLHHVEYVPLKENGEPAETEEERQRKPVMLFLHGFPEFWYSWRHQMKYFAPRYRVIALDLRGCGQTSKPTTLDAYQMSYFVRDVKEFLEKLGISQVVLVGHGSGGAIAWTLGLHHPHLIARMVVLNAPMTRNFWMDFMFYPSQFFKFWRVCFYQIPWVPEWVLSRNRCEHVLEYFMPSSDIGLQKNKFNKEEQEAYRANFSIIGCLTGSLNFYRALMRYPDTAVKLPDSCKKHHPTVECFDDLPATLLIWSDKDAFFDESSGRQTATLSSKKIHMETIIGCSHWAQQDAPDTVNDLINKFLNKHDP